MRDVADSPAASPEVAEQAEGFRRVREARRTALVEDYVEMIADLAGAKGEARSVDLACRFGVRQATVAKCVARLRREGFVRAGRYGAIQLTEQGERLAEHARSRHLTVVNFLKSIGVSPESAERDAEGIEHHVGEETLAAFARLIR